MLGLLALTIFSETAEKSNAANGRDEYLAWPFEPFLGCLRVISVNSLELCERVSARRVTQKHFELHKSIHRRPETIPETAKDVSSPFESSYTSRKLRDGERWSDKRKEVFQQIHAI